MSAAAAKLRIEGARGGQRWDPPENERTRGYQLEMFDESLKRNIVVTASTFFLLSFFSLWRAKKLMKREKKKMDTGSGKTHMYGPLFGFLRALPFLVVGHIPWPKFTWLTSSIGWH